MLRHLIPNPLKLRKIAYYNLLPKLVIFKLKYLKTKIFLNIFQNQSIKHYSQFNQDFIVMENFFKGKQNGVYCDIGANDPIHLNNTKLFEDSGWKGLAFEPIPYLATIWEQKRTAKFFPYAASDLNGKLIFSIVENTTGWEDMLSRVSHNKASDNKNEIEVCSVRLSEVFEQENIEHIDYMSIDVEGFELNVLKGIDFSKVHVNVLTIENNTSATNSRREVLFGNDQVRKFMSKNGFNFWGRIFGLDDIYVNQNFRN